MSAEHVAGAVLAGGRGRRIGADKASIELGGRSLALWSVDALRPVCTEVALVLRPGQELPPDARDVPVVRDRVHDAGPLAGLQAALMWAPDEWLLVTSCDQPFTVAGLLRMLLERRSRTADAAAARVGDRVHPLPGAYRKTSLAQVDASLSRGERSLQALLQRLAVEYMDEGTVRAIDPTLRSFLNINTVDDLQEARRLAPP